MLSKIELENFKCFDSLKLPLSPLNLLSGTNASGKSSVLQAIALLSQSMRENEWSDQLALNGNLVQLGTVGDVIDLVGGRSSFSISILDDSELYISWRFEGERNFMSIDMERIICEYRGNIIIDDIPPFYPSKLFQLMPTTTLKDDNHKDSIYLLLKRLSKLTYLTAERLGPRETYPYNDILSDDFVIGPNGENTANVLYSNQYKIVEDKLIHKKDISHTLTTQVIGHMNRFFPGFDLVNKPIDYTNMLNLRIRTSSKLDFHRPVNTGFGITQLLPIVVASLSAEKDDILIIENPEIHLHPAGQSMVGEFLTEVASAGVQVIVETHSDHVLNGIRRGVRNKIIDSNDVSLVFFQQRAIEEEVNFPQVQIIAMDKEGNLDAWPNNFFDQLEKDLTYIAGWS